MSTIRFEMPPEITEEMKQAAYREYCNRSAENYRLIGRSYIAFEDVCACFRAAFAAKKG